VGACFFKTWGLFACPKRTACAGSSAALVTFFSSLGFIWPGFHFPSVQLHLFPGGGPPRNLRLLFAFVCCTPYSAGGWWFFVVLGLWVGFVCFLCFVDLTEYGSSLPSWLCRRPPVPKLPFVFFSIRQAVPFSPNSSRFHRCRGLGPFNFAEVSTRPPFFRNFALRLGPPCPNSLPFVAFNFWNKDRRFCCGFLFPALGFRISFFSYCPLCP